MWSICDKGKNGIKPRTHGLVAFFFFFKSLEKAALGGSVALTIGIWKAAEGEPGSARTGHPPQALGSSIPFSN